MKRIYVQPVCAFVYPALFFLCGPRVFVLCLFAALLHECGHLFAIRVAGLRVNRISLTPTGLDIARSGGCSYLAEAWISFSGPFTGLLCALIAYFFSFSDFCAVNLVCSILNLLPALPLDGGCALRALLLYFLPLERAETVSQTVGVFTLVAVYTGAVLLLLYTGWNLTLLLLCAVIFCSCFIQAKN